MKFIEPAFDRAGEFWPASSDAPQRDISALENTIARQSSELDLRLTEVLELYNMQSRQAGELQAAREEIERLKQTISELQRVAKQQRVNAAVAQDKIACLEHDKAVLREQLDTLADQMAALDARKANAAAALEQISYLNSELAVATADRFKLVASVQGEKRRHNQQASFWQDKIKSAEVRAETREMHVKHLEAVRGRLDKRIQVLEALLESEREVAERKIARLTDELERYCSSSATGKRSDVR